MANQAYLKGLEAILGGDIDLITDNIKAVLVASTHTPNVSTHQFLSDISLGDRIATSANLSGKSVTNGVFDAADIVFTLVSGAASSYIVLIKDTGSAATSPLIGKIDGYTGLPITPSGADINVVWPNDANKVFALVNP